MRLGVCIPCHVSHVKYLEKCLESIYYQTKSPDIVSISISETDTIPDLPTYNFEVKITISQNHQCEGKNRNVAASVIDTEIITFFDADDIMHPRRLEIIAEHFTHDIDGYIHDNKLCASSQYRTRDHNRIPWEPTSGKLYTECFSTSKDYICGRVTSDYGGSTNGHFSCKRSVWESNPYPINYGLGVDSEYIYKLHHGGYKMGYNPDKLSYYVRDDFSIDNDLIIYDTFNEYRSNVRPNVYTNYENSEIMNVINFLLSDKSPERSCPIYIIDQVHLFPVGISSKIIYNIEQMTREDMFNRNMPRMKQPDIIGVWDYSISNYNILKDHKLNLLYVPFKLSIDKIIEYRNLIDDKKSYDIVFCGQMSQYRKKILDELRSRGKNVLVIEDNYTNSKDIIIGKCHLLINIHFNESYKIFEVIRCEPWLSSGLPVLTETSLDDDLRAVNVPYNQLVDKACEILDNIRKETIIINNNIVFYCPLEIRNPRHYDIYEYGRDIFIIEQANKCIEYGYSVTIYGNSLVKSYDKIIFKPIDDFNPSDEMYICILFPEFNESLIYDLTHTLNIFLYMDIDMNMINYNMGKLTKKINRIIFNSPSKYKDYGLIPTQLRSVNYDIFSTSKVYKNNNKILCTMSYSYDLFYFVYEIWPVIKYNMPEAVLTIILNYDESSPEYNSYKYYLNEIPGIIQLNNISHEELLYEKKESLLHINVSTSNETAQSIETSIEYGCIPILSKNYKKICGIHVAKSVNSDDYKNKLIYLILSLLHANDVIINEYRSFLISTLTSYINNNIVDIIKESMD